MINWLLQHLPEGLMVLGLAVLITEVVMLGFATFILLFFGLSLLITGFLMQLGVLPSDWVTALWSNALLTSVLGVALWKPLQRLQNKTDTKPVRNDFAEQSFVLEQDVDQRGLATHNYSGVKWKLKSQQPIAAGTLVKVVRTEVGVLWVEVCES
jgi:membrane protein implicated in regulation of membrane protease activity